MTIKDVESRISKVGTPPFTVWSGPPKSEEPNIENYGHHGGEVDASQAVAQLADMSVYGKYLHGQRIVDSTGKIVFDLGNATDVQLFRQRR